MLSFQLRATDCGGAWSSTSDGLHHGGSRIQPFRHPALEDVRLISGDRLLVFVRERSARANRPEGAFGVPTGRLTSVDAASFDRLALELRTWPLQWHSLTVNGAPAGDGADPERPLAALESGHWGTAPMFFVAEHGSLSGDWDAARLLPRLSASSLDPVRAARYLAEYANPYGRDTLFHGLQLLTERARATWAGPAGAETLSIAYPQPWLRPRAGVLREGADPVAAMDTIIEASIARWIDVAGVVVGVEVSGGLDSAIVASHAAAGRAPLRSYGVALIDGPERNQDGRRAEIVERFALIDTATPMGSFLPLAPGSCRLDGRAPMLPWEEGYYETFDALLAGAAADGVNVMLTGFGGDELCGLRPSEIREMSGQAARPSSRDPEPTPSFLTPRARATLTEALDLPPRAACSESAVECAALSAARYMRHGIWPVHPLCTPELVQFCVRLPPEWRHKRRIEREVLARAGLSRRVTHPSHTDNFSPAMAEGLRGPARRLVRELFADPALHRMGVVDRDELVRTYDAWCKQGPLDEAVHYFAAAVTELCLKAMR